jgi:hypothetical protein
MQFPKRNHHRAFDPDDLLLVTLHSKFLEAAARERDVDEAMILETDLGTSIDKRQSMSTSIATPSAVPTRWIVDSGAGVHLTKE